MTTSGGLDKVKGDIDDLGTRAKGAGGGFNALQAAGTAALAAVAAAAVAAAIAVGKFVADSIGKAGDFQAGMLAFGAAAGQGFEQGTAGLKEFQDLFIDLGKRLPVSTQEVQDAAIALVKGGIDPAVIRAGALESALQFAAAAGMDLAKAAELTTKMLGTFVPIGASVTEQTNFMADAQNLMVKAANASTLNVDKLGDAMLQAAGAAKGSGVAYQDFVTTMGLISPAFGSASEAGTSFKNFLARLVPATDKAKESFHELGLMTTNTGKIMDFLRSHGIQPLGDDLDTLGNQFTELMVAQGQTAKETEKIWSGFAQSTFFDETTGKFLGMEVAAEKLKIAFAGMSDAARTEALNVMFGNDAKGAAIALIDAGAEGYQLFAEKMLAANGVQQQAAATQQGFNFAMENLKGTLEALQITLGLAFLPILTDVVNQLNAGVGVVMGFVDAVTTAPDPIMALAGALLSVIPQFSTSGAAVGTFTGMLGTFLTVAQNVGAGYMAIFQAVLPIVQSFWAAHGTQVMAFVQTTWTQIMTIITTAMQIYNAIIPPVLQAVAGFIAAHGTEIQGYFTALWTIVTALITGALGTIQGIVQLALAVIKGDWSGAWDAIKLILQSQLNALIGVITGLSGMFVSAWTGVLNAAKAAFQSFVATLPAVGQSMINGMVQGVQAAAGRLVAAAVAAVKAAISAAKSAIGFGSPAKEFIPLGESMPDGVAVGIRRNTAAATDAVTDAMKKTRDAAAAAVAEAPVPGKDRGGMTTGQGLAPVVKPIVQSIIDPLQEIMNQALSLGIGLSREQAAAYMQQHAAELAAPAGTGPGKERGATNNTNTRTVNATFNYANAPGKNHDAGVLNALAGV